MPSLNNILNNGRNIAFLVGTAGVLYFVYKSSTVLRETLERAGLVKVDLGPTVESLRTVDTLQRETDFIRLGYLTRLPDGSTVLTPLGDAYIAEQNALE